MHRIWMGTDPHVVMSGLAAFLVGAALFLHMWAFSQFNWPSSLKARYATPPAATR